MQTSVLVGTTTAPYKTQKRSDYLRWLSTMVMVRADAESVDADLTLFAALEFHDGTDPHVYDELLEEMEETGLPSDVWTFSIDNNEEEITTEERLFRICTGRNMIVEYAMREGFEWILYLDSDLAPDGKTISKLLAVEYPIVGGDVPHYVLNGPSSLSRTHWNESVNGIPLVSYSKDNEYNFPVQEHWNTAGYLMVHRSIFRHIRWRTDIWADEALTDDPCYQHDVIQLCGLSTRVRKDVVGIHDPLIPVEDRGHDLRMKQ